MSLRYFWFLLFFLGSLSGLIAQESGLRIRNIEIRHVGPPAASEAMVKGNIKVREGDTYNRTSIDDDVRTLYATGLFHNIQVLDEITPQGVNLVYLLQGKPTVADIQFEGNEKYSDRKLRGKITSKVGEPLDERKLFMDSREILKLYQKAGRQKTEVSYNINIDESTGRGTVIFQIDEAPKVRIERVDFEGNEEFSDRKLRGVIKTRRHWFFSWLTGSGVLKDEVFQEDKEKLAQFYHSRGYIDFEIKEVQFDVIDPSHMIVRFTIFEGKQYRVGQVSFKGNSLFSEEALRERLRMGVGEVFTPEALRKDVEALRDFYGEKGYIDTWIKGTKIPNTETGTMDLVYEVMDEEKGQSLIEKIEIRGNVKTKDKVIRRELAVSPGEVFDMVAVQRSKSRLEQMGYFEEVQTQPEPTDIPTRKNLIIDVEEGTTGNFEVGAGFSSVDSLVGFVGYREGNFDLFNPPYFRGGGQKFRIYMQIGTRRRDYQVSFTEPWFLGKKLELGVDLYHRELNFFSDVYDLTQTGTRVGLRKALGSDFLIGGINYTIENISIDDIEDDAPEIIKREPDRLITKFGTSIAYDTRNSVMLPSGGQRTELLTELAGPFGGDTDFYKLEVRTSWFFPGLFWWADNEWLLGHVLELYGRAGVADEYGRSDRVPLFDRFALGGVYSLRGYRYRDVGPQVDDEPIGGETYWFGSLEYSVPIIERLRFAIFYDIGNVYLNAYSFSLVPGQEFYSDNWGFGLRLNIPRLGPLRLDYGIPITHDEETSGSGRFQFSVGFQRDF